LIAGIAYYWLQTAEPSSPAIPDPQVVALASPSAPAQMDTQVTGLAPERAGLQLRSVKTQESADEHSTSQEAGLPEATSDPPQPSPQQPETVKTALAPAAVSESPPAAPPGRARRAMDPEQISILMTQGEKHLSVGDVVTARTLFQRAAEAGDAAAALALAATYDPVVLAKLGVMGMGADVEKARTWYRMAESYGSAEAKQRLEVLDRR
jgi:hypothetical protein